jgi:hypothetical protein
MFNLRLQSYQGLEALLSRPFWDILPPAELAHGIISQAAPERH